MISMMVSNIITIYEWYDSIDNPNDNKIYGYGFCLPEPDKKGNTAIMIRNNQPCKAEVTGDKAAIVELIK